jgi:hypothetical protein
MCIIDQQTRLGQDAKEAYPLHPLQPRHHGLHHPRRDTRPLRYYHVQLIYTALDVINFYYSSPSMEYATGFTIMLSYLMASLIGNAPK